MTSASARHRALLVVHILTTVGVFGADLVLLRLGISALFGADARSVYPPSHLIAEVVVQPLAIASLVTGVALGLLSGWGIARYWWTAIKLAITAVLTLVVVGVLVPRHGAAADLAGTPHVFTMLEELPLAVAPVLASSLLIANVALAIYKPRWRLRGSSTDLGRPRPAMPEIPEELQMTDVRNIVTSYLDADARGADLLLLSRRVCAETFDAQPERFLQTA